MKTLIVGFEGLGGAVMRSLYRRLIKNYESYYECSMHGWLPGKLPDATGRKLVCVSHSFGSTASIKYAAKYPGSTLVLLDPRMAWTGLGGQVAPMGVKTYCLYRKGIMRGFTVEGAENLELPRSVSHLAVPSHPLVRELMDKLVRV